MKIIAVTINFQSKMKSIGIPTIIIDNNKINRGFAKAANLGIKQALEKSADKILLVNPDIKITQNEIKKLAQNKSAIVSPILKFERQGKTILDYGGKVNWLLGRPTHNESKNGAFDYVSFACVLIDKKVFEKTGLLDENFFMYFEDVDFCLRAKRAGFTIAVDPDVVVEHAISEHKFSGNSAKKRYILESNRLFTAKWISAWFQPFARLYLTALSVKSKTNQ